MKKNKNDIISNIYSIIPGTQRIQTYDSLKKQISSCNIKFSILINIDKFLLECSWVNYNNKLYILGGKDSEEKISHLFLEYDGKLNKLKRLPDSKFAHCYHSLFVHENIIYCVGGKENECEKYDIISNIWTSLPKLNNVQQYPVLFINNDYLYSFFGNDEKGKRTDIIQKINIKNNKSKWNLVNYNKGNCNLKMYGCGVLQMQKNIIYFFGGKLEHDLTKDAVEFNFINEKFDKTDAALMGYAYFKDNVLWKLGDDIYGNFSIEKNYPLQTITVELKKQ